jgi:hypothetical protein
MIVWTTTSRGSRRGLFRDCFQTPCHIGESVDGRVPLLTLGPDMGAMFLTRDQAITLHNALGRWLQDGALPLPAKAPESAA